MIRAVQNGESESAVWKCKSSIWISWQMSRKPRLTDLNTKPNTAQIFTEEVKQWLTETGRIFLQMWHLATHLPTSAKADISATSSEEVPIKLNENNSHPASQHDSPSSWSNIWQLTHCCYQLEQNGHNVEKRAAGSMLWTKSTSVLKYINNKATGFNKFRKIFWNCLSST